MANDIRPQLDRNVQGPSGDAFSGWTYTRYVTVPLTQLADALSDTGELAKGSDLPVAWGGSETPTPLTPKLQSAVPAKQPNGGRIEVVLTYLGIDQ